MLQRSRLLIVAGEEFLAEVLPEAFIVTDVLPLVRVYGPWLLLRCLVQSLGWLRRTKQWVLVAAMVWFDQRENVAVGWKAIAIPQIALSRRSLHRSCPWQNLNMKKGIGLPESQGEYLLAL